MTGPLGLCKKDQPRERRCVPIENIEARCVNRVPKATKRWWGLSLWPLLTEATQMIFCKKGVEHTLDSFNCHSMTAMNGEYQQCILLNDFNVNGQGGGASVTMYSPCLKNGLWNRQSGKSEQGRLIIQRE